MRKQMTQGERVTRLEFAFDDLSGDVRKVVDALYGNGKPGLLSDFRQLKENVKQHHEAVDALTKEKKSDIKFVVTTLLSVVSAAIALVVALVR